jgi:hypothetical protein
VTNEVLINEGARKDGGEDLTVIDPAAKSPAPGSQYLGRVQVPPPASADASDARIATTGAAEGIGNIEVTVEPQQSAPGDTTVATSTFEGSPNDFSINDVPDPTMELLLDPLLHPDKVSCMMEFGHRFFEYTKVSSHTICSIGVVENCKLILCHLPSKMLSRAPRRNR